jgi:preprotein translocase subunit SecE
LVRVQILAGVLNFIVRGSKPLPYNSVKMNTIRAYLSEVMVELSKVSWPTREQLIESTTVTVVGMLLLSAFLFVIDFLFTNGLKLIYGN